jgi:hypothetical protein
MIAKRFIEQWRCFADRAEFELLLVCKTFCRALLAFAKMANQKLESAVLASGRPATLIRELMALAARLRRSTWVAAHRFAAELSHGETPSVFWTSV